MQQKFLRKNNTQHLCLFAMGWGMDENLFLNDIPDKEEDILACYDWRTFDFDISAVHNYSSIRVVAWSLGVWAFSYLLHKYPDLNIRYKTAINGTMFPVDEEKGIAPDIFEGTLAALNHDNLNRFRRRMCGENSEYEYFMKNRPRREIGDLTDELEIIGSLYNQNKNISMEWDRVIIGNRDKIFLPTKQAEAWKEKCESIWMLDKAHFFRGMLYL